MPSCASSISTTKVPEDTMAWIPVCRSTDVIDGRCVRSSRRVDWTAKILMQMYDNHVYISLLAHVRLSFAEWDEQDVLCTGIAASVTAPLPYSRQFHALIRQRVIVKACLKYSASRNLDGRPARVSCPAALIILPPLRQRIMKMYTTGPVTRRDATVCVICNCVRELHTELTSRPIKFNDRWLRVREDCGRR